MKVALINVRFSANLGDGLLSECLEAELARQIPGLSIVNVDLAGRTAYGGGSPWRRRAMQALMLAPQGVRKFATGLALRRLARRLGPRFSEALADCDAAIVGGGNLLADMDLNFPVKISKALEACGDRRPVAVFAVGVSRNWSPKGTHLFARAFDAARLVHVSVRDGASRDALVAQAPDMGRREIAVVRDPGLLASQHYPAPTVGEEKPIGLCITDPLALRYHGGRGASDDVRDWFGKLAGQLAAGGHTVLLFTNGSPEDRHFLAVNAPNWCAAHPARIRLAQAAQTPAGLVGTVAGCSLVIAHRMHACIAAHSFAIPTIGLKWDAKLDAFFASAGRSDYLFTAGEDPVDLVVKSAERALALGVDRDDHGALLASARDDVALLAMKLREAVAA